MKTPTPQPAPWRAEDSFGALFVIATLASLAVTLWLGWPEVRAWLLSL